MNFIKFAPRPKATARFDTIGRKLAKDKVDQREREREAREGLSEVCNKLFEKNHEKAGNGSPPCMGKVECMDEF